MMASYLPGESFFSVTDLLPGRATFFFPLGQQSSFTSPLEMKDVSLSIGTVESICMRKSF